MTEYATEHAEQIRHAFLSHEYLAPDAAAVLARVEVLARIYRRRLRGAQAAGGAVLGTGLVTGAVALPAVLPGTGLPGGTALPGGTGNKVIDRPPAAPLPTATPTAAPTTPSPTTRTAAQRAAQQRNLHAYFQAGYGYEDAVRLAAIWNVKDKPGTVKAEAGRRLRAGENLPIRPSRQDADPARTGDPRFTPEFLAAVDAFFDAGYDYQDAAKLAVVWNSADVSQAKADAGQRILEGRPLPIAP
jgi:hypothetical protein